MSAKRLLIRHSTEASEAEACSWVESFRKSTGRAPRVLHIGNIANNAYKNVKFLNEAGLDCDVLCYDYYHIMGCPEWEDADFVGEIKDQFFPNWDRVDLRGFVRPAWFAQGPLVLCIRYLVARRSGSRLSQWLWGRVLLVARQLQCTPGGAWLRRTLVAASAAVRRRFSLVKRALRLFYTTRRGLWLLFSPLVVMRRLGLFVRRVLGLAPNQSGWFRARVVELIQMFAHVFPDRTDRLSSSDLSGYAFVTPLLKRLFAHYDVIQAYATAPILPLLAGFRPFVAFEHGTLRDFTLRDDPTCRNTALAYRLSDHAFITNGDCLEYARRLRLESFSPMIHPIDVDLIRATPGDYASLHARLRVRHLFLCTLRHDWKIKGTDMYIRALPRLREILGRDLRLIMTNWGMELAQSRALAQELGVAELIEWIEPLHRRPLVRMQKSVDVLFDQLALPHFGATAVEGLAAEVPVIMSYEPSSTAWIIPEPAPLLSAWNVDQIVDAVKYALDPSWCEGYRLRARRWIDRYHAKDTVVRKHVEVYRRLCRVSELPSGAQLMPVAGLVAGQRV